MPNAMQTAQIVTNEVLRIAHNQSAFLGNMNTDYDKTWNGKYGPGATIQARRPVQFTIRNGATANIQDITESTVPVTVRPELGIDFAVSDFELATAVRENGEVEPTFKERYLKPAGLRIAAELDLQVAQLVKNATPNFVGTPGTGPTSYQDLANAQVPLDNFACPRDGMRYAAFSPVANAALIGGLSGLFNAGDQISKNYKKGVLQDALGLGIMMSQNVPSHTVGPLGGAPVVNGANQGLINVGTTDNPYAATTSLVTNGWTAAAALRLRAGDVITLGINSVNPETKVDNGQLMQFVVTQDTSSDGAGNATIVISPAIIAGGAYQNVVARPTNGVAVTVVTGAANTTYRQNILWHRDAITFVSPELELPKNMDMAASASLADEGSISLRFVRGFDILNNRRISRFDVLWGAAVTLPNWVVRRTS